MITFRTTAAESLLAKIKTAIEDGKVVTWRCDKDGDFTHTPEQWAYQAWLVPAVWDDRLELSILGRSDARMSKVTYAVYHGRFVEMVTTHFDLEFETAEVTALGAYSDSVGQTA